MIDSFYRDKYQSFFINPVISMVSIHPSLVTLLGCVLGILAAPFIAIGYPFIALFLLLASGYLDTLDGSIARHLQKTSPEGTVFDIVSDRIVEFTTILGLFLKDPDERGLNAILMVGSVLICVTSFLVVGIFAENNSEKSFHYSPGIMERGEAFLFFFLMILFPPYFDLISTCFIFLCFLTGAIRVWQFVKQSS